MGGQDIPLLTDAGQQLQLAPVATLDDLLPHVYETGLYHLVARVANLNHRITARTVVTLHVPYRPRPSHAAPAERGSAASEHRAPDTAARPLRGDAVNRLLREQITEMRGHITRLEGDVEAARKERDAAIAKAAACQVRIAQLDTSNGHLASQLAERPAGGRDESEDDFNPLELLNGLNSAVEGVDVLARKLGRLGEPEATKGSAG
ncbi:MAG: hypothetical protein R3F65_23695 [bacterium]